MNKIDNYLIDIAILILSLFIILCDTCLATNILATIALILQLILAKVTSYDDPVEHTFANGLVSLNLSLVVVCLIIMLFI